MKFVNNGHGEFAFIELLAATLLPALGESKTVAAAGSFVANNGNGLTNVINWPSTGNGFSNLVIATGFSRVLCSFMPASHALLLNGKQPSR